MEKDLLVQLERWYHRGEYGRIVFTCDRLLKDSRFAKLKPDILFWKGNAHERAGRAWHGEAIACYREGIAAARNRAIKARLMAALGKIYSETGDANTFDQLMAEFHRITRREEPELVHWGAFVWFNYGVTLDNCFRYAEAASAYSKAAEWAARTENHALQGQSLHNLGGVLLEMGDLPQAASVMAQAEELLGDEHYGHKKLSRRAEYFLKSGDLLATQHMITAAIVHPLLDDHTRGDLYFTWARTLKALRHDVEAQEKALLALDFAVRAVHYPTIHRVNQFLHQLTAQAG